MKDLSILEKALAHDKFYVNKTDASVSLAKALKKKIDNKSNLYIQKQNDGIKSWKDPAGGDFISLAKNDLINSWVNGNLNDLTIRIWQAIARNRLSNVLTDEFYSEFVKDKLYIIPAFSSGKTYIRTRFGGLTVGKVLNDLGYSDILHESWKVKPKNYWIPSYWILIELLLKKFTNTNDLQTISNKFTKLMSDYSRLRENYFLLLYKDLLLKIEELYSLSYRSLINGNVNKNFNFILQILFRAFYIERIVNGLGLLHLHLHYDNLTVEFAQSSLNYSEILNTKFDEKKMTFDYEEYLMTPDKYKVVMRMIDLQGICFIDDWHYPENIFIDDTKTISSLID